MWHLLTIHLEESFLPFFSRQSLSCCLCHMAKRSTPKPHGPLSSPPKPHGLPSTAAMPGFKSQRQSSSAAPFPTPPTISYTCQHSLFSECYWAAIVSLGRCGPVARSQSSPSCHAGPVTRGVASQSHLGWESLPPPGSKHGHSSYLTYL